ncbi:MAG: MFS transporter [bacterium]|nr:MFS transporter [bacterium]
MDKDTVKSGRFAALKYRDFRLLWIGLLISNIGSQMQIAAVNWHIFVLTHSAVALGLIGLSRFLPITIFALVGGAVADAHNRRKILFITQTTLTIFSFILAISTLFNLVNPLIVYVITALSAVATAFDAPPRQAIIPSLVHKDHVSNAMSLNVIMFQTSMVAGPALAGIIIAQFGIGSVYFINAISFLAVIGALIAMKTSGEIEGVPSKISFGAVLEGLKFVKSKTIIWSTMLLDFFSTFFSSANSLLPIFAEKILHVGPVGFGFLYAAQAVGAVAIGYIMAHIGKIKNEGKLLIIGVALYGIATVIFGFSKTLWLSFICLLLIGAGDGISSIIRNTIRQLATPDYIRGRMTSINMIFFMGGPQLGEFEAGILASAVGAPMSVVIGGVGTLLILGLISVKIPILRNYSVGK